MEDEKVWVKLRTGRVGNNIAQYVGEEILVGESEAIRMVDKGQAEWCKGKPRPKAVTQ